MIFLNENKYANATGIYCIKNLINDKKYIGQTKDRFVERYWNHLWHLKQHSHFNRKLQYSFNKYGEDNFVFYILEELDNNEDINFLEQNYIIKYDSVANGYNMQYGEQPVNLHTFITEEHRKKVGEKNRIHMTGKIHSSETRRKMSASRRGSNNSFSKLNEEIVLDIRQRLLNGERPTDVARLYNITYGNIKMIRSGETWSHI